MTIDTDLRKRAEAVRDAGVASAYAHHVVKRLIDAGHSDLTSARNDARNASEALRGAQKRLYRDAPPDGILDLSAEQIEAVDAQVEREHAATVAPKPERPVVIWHHREDDEELPGGRDVDEAIYYAIHAAGWGMCGELKRPDMLGETVTVYGFARMQPTLAAWRYMESAIEDLDEEHGSPDGPFKATPVMVAASETFARTMEREYVSWACEVVETRVVNVREWCAVHRPDWLAQLPAGEPEEGGTR